MTEGARRHRYVGPEELLAEVRPGASGRAIGSRDDLASWLAARDRAEVDEPFTFVIDLAGRLRLAPQRSEHVACAGGAPVLSAGEIGFVRDGAGWTVGTVSNQSTGYCPDLASWAAVQRALDGAGIVHPGRFTHPVVFRRCPECHERNLVKDGHYVCALCDAELPLVWNFDAPVPGGRGEGGAARG